ncbi:MAG: glycosyltransferase [Candidatus Bilamarchaeaceae archaeon]
MFFSVVIPLYNKLYYIGRTIKSVLSQTYMNYELIVVDDGSTDKSVDVVRKFDDKRIRIIQQKNAGESAARNRGINEAKYEFIAFLDADDEWQPNFLAEIKRLCSLCPSAKVFATGYEIHNTNGKIINVAYRKGLTKDYLILIEDYFSASLSMGNSIVNSSSIVIHKEVFNNVGYFKENAPLGADIDMWGRIAIKYSIAYSPKICAIYHCDAENRTCKRAVIPSFYPLVDTYYELLKNNEIPSKLKKSMSVFVYHEQLKTIRKNYYFGNLTIARSLIKRLEPFDVSDNFKKISLLIITYFPFNLYKIGSFFKKLLYRIFR